MPPHKLTTHSTENNRYPDETWRNEKWAKHVPGPVMSETLDNIQIDDKRVPTLEEAL